VTELRAELPMNRDTVFGKGQKLISSPKRPGRGGGGGDYRVKADGT
jgi:hypothetical protein